MYLMWASVINIFSLSYSIPQNIYTYAYGDLTVRSLIYCRIRHYLGNVWGQMARFFILLACVDRYVLTNSNINIRALSRPAVARWAIGGVTIFWHVFLIHILILFKIKNGRCNATGLYYILYSAYYVFLVWFVPCIGMLIFGYIAYSNLKRLHSLVRPVKNSTGARGPQIIIHRRDRDLFVLVLTEVVAYVIMMLFYPGIIVETAITNYLGVTKSLEHIRIENFISTISLFFVNLTNAMPFYIYFAASKTFRKDFKTLVYTCWQKVSNRVVMIVH